MRGNGRRILFRYSYLPSMFSSILPLLQGSSLSVLLVTASLPSRKILISLIPLLHLVSSLSFTLHHPSDVLFQLQVHWAWIWDEKKNVSNRVFCHRAWILHDAIRSFPLCLCASDKAWIRESEKEISPQGSHILSSYDLIAKVRAFLIAVFVIHVIRLALDLSVTFMEVDELLMRTFQFAWHTLPELILTSGPNSLSINGFWLISLYLDHMEASWRERFFPYFILRLDVFSRKVLRGRLGSRQVWRVTALTRKTVFQWRRSPPNHRMLKRWKWQEVRDFNSYHILS